MKTHQQSGGQRSNPLCRNGKKQQGSKKKCLNLIYEISKIAIQIDSWHLMALSDVKYIENKSMATNVKKIGLIFPKVA
jgi:hypothetical protein